MFISSGRETKGSQAELNTFLLLGIAALSLGQAIQNGNGSLTLTGILWLTIALISIGWSLISLVRPFPRISSRFVFIVLVLGLIWQIYQLLTTLPGIYILPFRSSERWVFQVCIVLAGCFALLSITPESWLPSWNLKVFWGGSIIAFLAAGLWLIRVSPNPFIDVYVFHQKSGRALVQGQNPYEVTIPNIYGENSFYGEEIVQGDNLTIANPYPPLSIYLSSLGFFLGGDIRYTHLAAILLTATLIVFIRPSRETLLAAYIYLLTPRAFFVLEQSWTEPFVLLLFVVVIWCVMHYPTWTPFAFGLLIASKQYMIFMTPFILLLVLPGTRKRDWMYILSRMLGTAFIVTAPLALWNLPVFFWNVGLAQWYQVFRYDALSYAALYANITNHMPSQYIPFILLFIFISFTWRYVPRSHTGFAVSMAFGLGLFFAFSKQAFCNYYYLVIGILICAMATTDGKISVNRN